MICLGLNDFGQFGIGNRGRSTLEDVVHFGNFTSNNDVSDIRCGHNFTVVLHKNGQVNLCVDLCSLTHAADIAMR